MIESFHLDQFLNVLANYNLGIWPVQIIAYILGFSAVLFAFSKIKYSNRIISGILSFLWLWTGVVFCFIYWKPTYPYAIYIGILFIIQGILFLALAFKPMMTFAAHKDINSMVGVICILYAMAGYQGVGYFLNHTFPSSFPFGLVPCPLTIFTFGLFLLTNKKLPQFLILIPLIWGVSGILPVMKGIYEDVGLILSGIIGTYFIVTRDKRKSYETTNKFRFVYWLRSL